MVHHQDDQEIRKGPWTEQEDVQLNFYVNLFGDRRWDFIAKVSGLKRTGKSCRLRWVNYMHPGLKRGKMSPQEEKLVLELHSKWGNRWSKIARKLPGRTDNEIKNYWRTHMRKKAQEKKKAMSTSSSLSSICSSSSSSCSPTMNSNTKADMKESNFYDTGGLEMINTNGNMNNNQEEESPAEVYSMDEIWKDIELSEEDIIKTVYDSFNEEGSSFSGTTMASPIWDYCPDTLWTMDDQSRTFFMPTNDDQFDSFHSTQEQNMFLIG